MTDAATMAALRAEVVRLDAAWTDEITLSLAETAWRDGALRFARDHFADHPAAADPAWQGWLARLAADEADLAAFTARMRAMVERVLAEQRGTDHV